MASAIWGYNCAMAVIRGSGGSAWDCIPVILPKWLGMGVTDEHANEDHERDGD